MTPWYTDDAVTVWHGDALDVLADMADNSIDAVVTDPPAGISFMGRTWDSNKGGRDAWIAWLAKVLAECLRVAKPGAHAYVWALPRTSGWTHRAIEDAGWEVRDCTTHLFGSGFPKSLNLGDGRGTALKPASEHWYLARKPLTGTVAANVLTWGTGALNIDAARIEGVPPSVPQWSSAGSNNNWAAEGRNGEMSQPSAAGRWPPNVALDPHTAAHLDQQSGQFAGVAGGMRQVEGQVTFTVGEPINAKRFEGGVKDSGGASRFFPVFRPERICALFGMLTGCGRTPLESSTTSANTANAASATSPATVAGSAPEAARTTTAEWYALRASSAGTLCGACVIAIAQSVAATRHGRSATQALGLPSTADSSERILNRSVALIAEDLAKSATTSTTTDLTTSVGCVVDAISTYTTRAFRHERRRSGPSSDLPLWRYEPKAPTLERPRADDAAAHPTVKPLDLMRWLVRLVTPPGGVVLDPFLGSGTTAEACIIEGFRCVGVEREATYLPMIRARLTKPIQPVLDLGEL